MNQPSQGSFGNLDAGFMQSTGKESYAGKVWIFDSLELDDSLLHFPMKLHLPLFAVCGRGSATVHLNLDHYEIRPGSLIALMPDSTLHGITASPDLHAIFLGVDLTFAREVMPDIHALLPVMWGTRTNPVVELSDADAASLRHFHAFLWQIIRTERGCYKQEMVMNVLRAMLYKLMEIHHAPSLQPSKRSRNEEIFYRFVHLVERDYTVARTVQHYADELSLTPKHLSTVVKLVSGLTAGDWITNYVITSAKVLLRSTAKPISEIAEELSFPSLSFFGKYFKKHTTLSPQSYRKQHDH